MSAAVTLIDVSHVSRQLTGAQVASSPSNDVGGQPPPAAGLLKSGAPSVVTLADPSTGDERDYLVVPAKESTGSGGRAVDIFEVQSLLGKSKYGSYFVGSRVVSDSSLRVATRVDPLFFVLAAVEAKMKQSVDASATANTSSSGDGMTSTSKSGGAKWQPLDQLLADVHLCVREALCNASSSTKLTPDQIVDKQMQNLFLMTDAYGDDLILYKFDEKKAKAWLLAKHKRALHAAKAGIFRAKLREEVEKTEASKLSGGGGAFSSAFNMGDDEEDEKEASAGTVVTQSPSSSQGSATDASSSSPSSGDVAMLSKEEEKQAHIAALQLVCEYLSDGWRNKLIDELEMTEEDLLGPRGKKRKTNPEMSEDGDIGDADEDNAKPTSKWNGGDDAADKLQQIARGVDGCGGAAGTATVMDDEEREKAKKKEEKMNAKSFGLKKLSKVNTKGMKSLSSFFGGSKKKKKA